MSDQSPAAACASSKRADSDDSSDLSEPSTSRYSLRPTAGRHEKRAQHKQTPVTSKKKANNKREPEVSKKSPEAEKPAKGRAKRAAVKRRSGSASKKGHSSSPPPNKKTAGGQGGDSSADTQANTGNTCNNAATTCLSARNTVYPVPMAEGGQTPPNQPQNDPEIGRLQAMLEARGLPSNLFGSLGPRMQSLLGRGSNLQPNGRIVQLLSGMNGSDESQTLQSVIELCDILVMGNEETLGAHFPVKEVVKALMTCLKMEHNFDIMNNACRALTYLMEALPRSSPVVVEAVPLLIERLHRIECIDVAEHALTALELLSRRHAKNILVQGGIAACLQFLDFFSLVSQRAALQIASNCCAYLTVDELNYVYESIPPLINRLASQDKKSVECVCTLFTRLVDNLLTNPQKLFEISTTGLLKNVQQLVVSSPPLISTSTFVGIIRMLHLLCSHCTQLAVILLKENIGETIRYLLTGSHENNGNDIELVARTPQEQHEIVVLIGELLPRLPNDGVFEVESMLKRAPPSEHVVWSWKDDRQLWKPYTNIDTRILEAAYQSREAEVTLNAMGNTYTVDIESMVQVNDDTGTSRQVQRRVTPLGIQAAAANSAVESGEDARSAQLQSDASMHETIVTQLLPVCYEVYNSSAGPAIRHECIRTILRMICHTSPEVLTRVLHNLPLSSHIANMLSSSDLKLVVGAVQLVRVLLEKNSAIFLVYFKKEGVMHQVDALTKLSAADGSIKSASDPALPQAAPPNVPDPPAHDNNNSTAAAASSPKLPKPAVAQVVISKRRMTDDSEAGRASKLSVGSRHASLRTSAPTTRSRLRQYQSESSSAQSAKHDTKEKTAATKHAAAASAASSRASASSAASKTKEQAACGRKAGPAAYLSDKLSSLPLPKWAKPMPKDAPQLNCAAAEAVVNLQRVPVANFAAPPNPSMSRYFSVPSSAQYHQYFSSHQPSLNKEKVRAWIKRQAEDLLENYFSKENNEQGAEENLVEKLSDIAANLEEGQLSELFDLVCGSELSSFEMIHSGIIGALIKYITGGRQPVMHFAQLFMAYKVVDGVASCGANAAGFSRLVHRLNACLSQQEQFPLKVHELPAGPQGSLRGANALRFFHSHQIKCMLRRHPSCTNLKEWHRGPIKVDSLAQVAAIERYMLLKGYGRVKSETKEEETTDDDNSDDDLEEAMSANSILARGEHRIELLFNDKVLPYDISLFQAVRQYGLSNNNTATDTDTDSEINAFNYAAIWVNTHNLWYRLAPDETSSPAKNVAQTEPQTHSAKRKWTAKARTSPKNDRLWNEGRAPERVCPLVQYLCPTLPTNISDSCNQTLTLMRILYGLNRFWYTLSEDCVAVSCAPVLPYADFVNSKVSGKVSRQLQDPLTVLSQQVPPWIKLLAKACPFVLSLECRQSLLYCTAFDRDRALQHLLNTVPDLNLHDSHAAERITPRLERRKMCIQRTDLLKQADAVLNNMADGSRAVLEIQYQNEEGTGLGPTLEFYSLVSKELHKSALELWRGEKVASDGEEYTFNGDGLYPLSLPRSIKSQSLNKIKHKFQLMGKLMGRALLDSRMMDMSLSPLFFRWLLGEEQCLTLPDLVTLDPRILKSVQQLIKPHVTPLEIESLDLDFTFVSGSHTVEMKKGGKDATVNAENVNQYVKLFSHWLLVEGVQRQMEAFVEGFSSVVPLKHISIFYPEEMEELFCGSSASNDYWNANLIWSCLKPDHGYTHDSEPIRWLVDMMCKLDAVQRRRFLQFITGSPRLPVGGFKSLNPPLTVVRKGPVSGEHADQYLPSVMTCVNYLKLPHYSSEQVMVERFESAIDHGQSAFYLS